jgi:hypothetical protein
MISDFGESCEGRTCPEASQCIENLRSSGRPYAACAIGGATDPKCVRDSDKTYCEGNTWIACKGRYREQVEDCAERFCVEHGDEAKCVPSREPDEACDGNDGRGKGPFTFCRGNALVACIGPWARVPQECEGRFCRGIAGEATCRMQSEPDPRCEDRLPGDFSFCDRDVAVWCDGEWRDFEHDCAKTGRLCEEVLEIGPDKTPYAYCAPKTE